MILPPRPPKRSVTPPPATVSLQDVRRINVIRARLTNALHNSDTLVLLRESLVDLLCDISELPAGAALDLATEEVVADTVRTPLPWNDDQPPSTDIDSAEGKEFGGG